MKEEIISSSYQRLSTRSESVIGRILSLSREAGNEEMIDQMTDLYKRLSDPFMFVIVGEVKAGKSSFINALLDTGQDICAVAPSPMTDTIQQIMYGEEAFVESLSPYLKRVFQPVDILKEIAIVDTPGTNTIIAHHQEITESFIPASDLIVFVFEAKNPYRQSAWDFFHLIHKDWRKKILFVLQQKDLMSDEDLQVNLAGLAKHAKENGIEEPNIFAVSAKLEQEGDKEHSGFEPLRRYISSHITGGQAPFLKLQSSLSTGQNFLDRMSEALELRQKQLEADKAFSKEIANTLADQADRSHRQVQLLIDHLMKSYDEIWNHHREVLSDGLSFFSLIKRSVRSIFSKEQGFKPWLEQLAGQIESDMQNKLFKRLSQDVDDLADAIQDMIRLIDMKLQQTQTFLSRDMEFFRDIADKRSRILSDLRQTFGAYIDDRDNFRDEKLFPQVKDVAPSVATGSGVAIIGLVLTAVTNGAVLDFTGGIVTAIGLLFAGLTTGLNKRKILAEFDLEMQKGKSRLSEELGDQLAGYIDQIREDISKHFVRFNEYIDQEESAINRAQAEHSSLVVECAQLENDVRMAIANAEITGGHS